MNPFDILLVNPILNLLILFYKGLLSVSAPAALGLSIILLTTVIRLAIWPLVATQLKSTKKLAELKPHTQKIKEKHGHDKVRHQQELAKLYKEHGVNPAAGCLPAVLQIPLFFALYQVLSKIVEFDKSEFLQNINSRLYSQSLHLDKIPDHNLLGFSLAARPAQWSEVGLIILLVPVITGLLQFAQSMMMSNPAKKPQKSKNGEGLEDTMAQVQSQMNYILPVMIGFFSYNLPIGLSLYWNTFTVIGIIQQYKISGLGKLEKYLPQPLAKSIKTKN